MRIVISPAKKLNEQPLSTDIPHSMPLFLPQAQELINIMREKDSFAVAELMKLSMKLADLNVSRFQQWHAPFNTANAKQAVFSFAGEVYQGLDVESLNTDDIVFAQNHLRILSGLYGLLRPLDLMQAYRLEMGTRLKNTAGNNLYDFWGSSLTDQLNTELADESCLINLASQEYFKAIQSKRVRCPIITPVFKENKGGMYKVIGIYAKRARGLMVRYIIQHKITDAASIKGFAMDGYTWNPSLSDGEKWVFTRG
ncbi:MAG: peroxide stress protein YaaA [Ghiorsea sp.]